jgi:hypothetical protein
MFPLAGRNNVIEIKKYAKQAVHKKNSPIYEGYIAKLEIYGNLYEGYKYVIRNMTLKLLTKY